MVSQNFYSYYLNQKPIYLETASLSMDDDMCPYPSYKKYMEDRKKTSSTCVVVIDLNADDE